MKLAKKVATIIAVSAVPAIIVAAFFTYYMIHHNSQGQSFDTVNEKYNYIHILKFFSLNFIILFATLLLLTVLRLLIYFLFHLTF